MYTVYAVRWSGTRQISAKRAQECGSYDALSTKARSSGQMARLVPAGIFTPSLGSRVKCGAAAPTISTPTVLERSYSAKNSPSGMLFFS